MIIRKQRPVYSDGTPMAPGDELEVGYPDIQPIPHRGLIGRIVEGPYGVTDIEIVHNSKSPGVCVVGWNDFAQGQEVRLLRQPFSTEHAMAILQRAASLIGHPYNMLSSNCEQFTDFCYNGIQGESPTLQKGVIAGLGIVALFALVGDRS